MILTALSCLICFATIAAYLQVALGMRKMKRLSDIVPLQSPTSPRISIIFSALNEAHTIEPALHSLLALDYPNLEIIGINDRSTDQTGAVLERLSKQHPQLRTLHIRELPIGWLGKNHALYRGAALATGDYLLFTDADVVFDPSSLSRAVQYCEQNRLAHLTVLPSMPIRGLLLPMLIQRFKFALAIKYQPWKVANSTRHYLGVGAFNMVSREAYVRTDGHHAFALDVIDDIALGKQMKMHGLNQDALIGDDLVKVEWYQTVEQMFKGLEKNVFAGFGYSLIQLVVLSALFLLATLWPWLGLAFTSGPSAAFCLAAVLVEIVFYGIALRSDKGSLWSLVFLPITPLLSVWMWWQGSLKVLLKGEIVWRGTRYSLAELKRCRYC